MFYTKSAWTLTHAQAQWPSERVQSWIVDREVPGAFASFANVFIGVRQQGKFHTRANSLFAGNSPRHSWTLLIQVGLPCDSLCWNIRHWTMDASNAGAWGAASQQGCSAMIPAEHSCWRGSVILPGRWSNPHSCATRRAGRRTLMVCTRQARLQATAMYSLLAVTRTATSSSIRRAIICRSSGVVVIACHNAGTSSARCRLG